jgi:L-fuculokinase
MTPICAIFDIGKTNKKLLGFDQQFNLVYEKQVVIDEILDDDGEFCDNLLELNNWVREEWDLLNNSPDYKVIALNFSGYGASLVYIGANGNSVGPLYNYLKKFPKELKAEFENKYNKEGDFFKSVASPDLGMLNSGMQFYWLKKYKSEIFKKTKYALHFPQYLSYLFTNEAKSEFTSIGCHTAIWDFSKSSYHDWLFTENLKALTLPPTNAKNFVLKDGISIGVGIHDSSAALVPYLKTNDQPFVLISTGTWCISINPFNTELLSHKELASDCLNFISFEGKPVRASRLFSGNEHGRQVKHLAAYFNVEDNYYKNVRPDFKLVQNLRKIHKQVLPEQAELGELKDCPFVERNLNSFKSFEEAYHQFIMDLVAQQIASTRLTFGLEIPKKIYVDGGFSKNEIFMSLLAEAFINIEVYASEVAQASSLGAALVISEQWTDTEIQKSALKLKRFY